MTQRTWVFAVAVLALAASGSLGADPSGPARAAPAAADVKALAATIDRLIAARWADAKVEPAPAADDAEFLRRVYLDLAGRIPSVYEARTFLGDPAPDRRQRLVERLLESPRYVTHFTNVWRSLLLPEANATLQARLLVPGLEAWLRTQLIRNAGYDDMVRALLTATVTPDGGRNFYVLNGQAAPSPLGFYQAKENKPENLAASTSRLFLGVRLECAECHNHPFAKWKRDQFWSYAAFFADMQPQGRRDPARGGRQPVGKRGIAIPGTEKVVQAAFLDGGEPRFQADAPSRATLADWLTARDNPFFARAAVNRMWFHFFGTGLIDPVDEMVGGESVASHPELLDELARAFANHQFDLKFLIRALTASRAYQLSSLRTHPGQDDPRLFARIALRGLSPEQLLDSVAEATRYPADGPTTDVRALLLNNSPQGDLLAKFANQSDKATEVQMSILQALTLMNGRLVSDATSLERSETLAAVVGAPFMDTPERIETLYLAALSRKPTPKESDRLIKYVDGGGAGDKNKSADRALADVFWALLNSGEFILNH